MPTIPVNEAELYYEIHGEGATVVLAHGIGGNHAIWYQQVAVLSRSYQVLVFDHRGFGNSTDPQGLGRSGYVDDLKALLDYLQVDKAALIGQSMGGGTCVCFTCTWPERVSALVIADCLHGLVESDDVQALMDVARSATKDLSQIERVLGYRVRKQNPAAAVLYQQINSFNASDRHNLQGQYEKIYTPQELAATKVPTLFIAGMEDVLFPIEAIRKMQEQVDGSFIVELHDTGHSAFYESPVEFNDSVLSMLQMAGVKGRKRSVHSNTAGYVSPES